MSNLLNHMITFDEMLDEAEKESRNQKTEDLVHDHVERFKRTMKKIGLIDSLEWVDGISVPSNEKLTILMAISPYITKHPADTHDISFCLRKFPWSRSYLGKMIS